MVSRGLAIAALCGLAACGGRGGPVSYVEPGFTSSDTTVLSSSVSEFVTMRVPVETSTLIVEPSQSDGQDGMATAINERLRRSGYVVAEQNQRAAGQTSVNYMVGQFDQATLLRMQVGDWLAARMFQRNTSGALTPSGAFHIREPSR